MARLDVSICLEPSDFDAEPVYTYINEISMCSTVAVTQNWVVTVEPQRLKHTGEIFCQSFSLESSFVDLVTSNVAEIRSGKVVQ